MRIALVHTYPPHPGREPDDLIALEKERRLAVSLARVLGGDALGFSPTAGSNLSVPNDNERSAWQYVAGDDALLAAVVAFKPDVLLVKGAQTRLSNSIVKRCRQSVLVAITGGAFQQTAFGRFDVLATENSLQETYFRNMVGLSEVIHLPKYVGSFADMTEVEPSDVLVISSFLPWKNVEVTQSLAGEPIRIIFAGDGPRRQTVESIFKGARAEAVFLGKVPPAVVHAHLRRAKVLLHPSLSEGFPRAVAEAMSHGVPVVAVQGVVGEPAVDGVSALLVEAGDLAVATMRLLRDEGLRARLSHSAQKIATKSFSQEALEVAVQELTQAIYRSKSRSKTKRDMDRFQTLLRATAHYQSRRVIRGVRRRIVGAWSRRPTLMSRPS